METSVALIVQTESEINEQIKRINLELVKDGMDTITLISEVIVTGNTIKVVNSNGGEFLLEIDSSVLLRLDVRWGIEKELINMMSV